MYFSEAIVPVADLRSEPTDEPLMVRNHDRRRLTQILSGQCVHVLNSKNGWSEVEIPEQMMDHALGHPRAYRGYVVESALQSKEECSCHCSSIVPWSEEVGIRLLSTLRSFVAQPYLWGGLSRHLPSYHRASTGPDCSGLVWLAYKEIGIFIPRDAADQCAAGRPISPIELRRGDLIFKAPVDGRVNHVLAWSGSTVIESTDSGEGVVREVTFEERFGIPRSKLTHDGSCVEDVKIFFRRYLES
jgi:hypothetical protein